MAHLLCDEDSYVEPPNSADIQLLVLSDPDSNSESREYENTQIVLWEQEAPFYSEEMDAVTLPSDCEVVFLINSDVSDPSADVDLCDISMMEKELHPVNLQLQELLKEAQKIKITLLYSQNLKNHEDLVSSFMAFVALCQPYFTYTESTARSVIMDQNPLPEYIRRELLHFSQQLSTCLENLIKMFATFSLITLDEADPCGMSHFCCGEVRLESWYRVLLFRYCSLTPFNARDEPHSLYKKMRWNVELLENSCPSQGEAETK
ncbi:UPF0575 protein C19orf67 homolog [Erpetoichthys calabaricus]|uniref:UPF0575 protein C19orf67 homolog n=1 Tax=Erpetoichthys calabaricus TaxID=27687 RepID=UPI0022340EAB|nr:UPF0575 protein C19orf67 homolog [Erpetoichthys calabaricus]